MSADQQGLSLKEIFEIAKEYSLYIRDSWKWILASCLLLATIQLILAINTPVEYKADLSFMVDSDEGQNMGALTGVLGNLGIQGGAGGKFNLQKIMELARSQKMVQTALLKKIKIKEKDDFIANHILRIYDYHEDWKNSGKEQLMDFWFTTDTIHQDSLIPNLVLKRLYKKVIGSSSQIGLLRTTMSEESGIMKMKVQTISEPLSKGLCIEIYNVLSDYYVNRSVGKQRNTYNILQSKTDSIATALNSKEYKLARFIDQNRSVRLRTDNLEEARLRREIQMLTIMYGESLKNLQLAEFSLSTKTPFIQTIDMPVSPLPATLISKTRAILIGFLVGLILSSSFLVLFKFIQESIE